MAGGTEARRDALRREILDAAEQVIADRGLGALGMRHLADRAGCSLGMVYKLFADGDEVVLRVNLRTLHGIGRAMEGAAADTADTADRAAALRAMALAYLDYAAAHRFRWDALFVHRMAGGADVPPWYAAERTRAFGILTRHADPSWTQGAAEGWAQTLFSAVHGVVLLGLGEKLGDLASTALKQRLLHVVDALGDLPRPA